MKQRGRKSLEAVATPVTALKRPEAPMELTEEQAEVWYATVNRMPAEWFSEGEPHTLASYCRHVSTARRVAGMIAASDHDPECTIEDYDRLLKMQERETRAILSCATKMRLTQQSTLDPDKRKNPRRAKAPWEQ